MEPLVAGHRRRRSSLMNPQSPALPAVPSSSSSAPNSIGPGGGPGLHVQTNLADEDKIVEEDGAAEHGETGRLLHGGSRRTGRDGESDDSDDGDLHGDEETGLTRKERRRRHLKRKRNARPDRRVVPDGVAGITEEEKKEADKNVMKESAVNVVLILLWYLFSLSISLYNKWMFGEGRLNFAFPLFTTSAHMLVQFALASIILYLFPSLRPKKPLRRPGLSDQGRSRHQPEPDNRPLMTKMFFLTRIGPCGAATGLDIGLGNMSLKFITLTFYTMCKSSTLGFVLLFAFLFRLESPTWRLVGIVATMTAGVIMMVAGEVEFSLIGFCLIISAAFFSGFRWGLTQILLLRNPATSNPFSSIFYLAPVMFVTLFCIAIPVEGPRALVRGVAQLVEDRGVVVGPLILFVPGCIAFLMTASEFALLQRTSVVTLSIAGICKEVVTIIAAALVFGDSLTPVNFLGLVTTIGAICAYNWIKITKMRREAQSHVHRQHMPPGSASDSAGGSPAASDDEPTSAVSPRRSEDVSEQPLITSIGEIVPGPSRSG